MSFYQKTRKQLVEEAVQAIEIDGQKDVVVDPWIADEVLTALAAASFEADFDKLNKYQTVVFVIE